MNARVLIIEDDADLAELMGDFCQDMGAQSLVAWDGTTGLAMAMAEKPDVIVLDHRLPDMSGLDVLARLKTDPQTRLIPLIYCSADAHLHEAEARRAGAAWVLEKPVMLGDLKSAITTLVPSA